MKHDKLRELAQNATPGPWHWGTHEVPALHGQGGDPDVYVYEADVIEAGHSGECGCRSACELELNVSEADAEFIAAANPTVVLALLDELRDAAAHSITACRDLADLPNGSIVRGTEGHAHLKTAENRWYETGVEGYGKDYHIGLPALVIYHPTGGGTQGPPARGERGEVGP